MTTKFILTDNFGVEHVKVYHEAMAFKAGTKVTFNKKVYEIKNIEIDFDTSTILIYVS